MKRTALLASLFLLFYACGSNEPPEPNGEEPTDPNGPVVEPPDPPEPLPGLPESTAGFDSWLKMNAEPIPPKPSDPHRGTKDMFVNQTREEIAPGGENRYPYPDGTIIVKSAVRPDKDFIGLVAVMTKTKGTNPNSADWNFIEFSRGGPDEPFRKLAEGRLCESCHARAADTDYSFTVLE